MDLGQIIFAYSRLILGALAAFLAIMLWAKTRDAAWMLIVIGIIVAYIEIIYSILEAQGITFPFVALILPSLEMLFFIAAFLVMVVRLYRRKV
ncbi:MAG: hypothetical protein LBI06_03415 [Treponema sp.]|jgi:peptidoglycan/LPS O-acetylase OafA/YrhL|nr:hypothetical protein [Treponema sp.]